MSYFVIAKSAVASELMILPSRLFPSLHTTQSLHDAEVYRLSLCKLAIVGMGRIAVTHFGLIPSGSCFFSRLSFFPAWGENLFGVMMYIDMPFS